MNTPSHFLMTAALEKSLPRIPIVKRAFLLGSVMPDLPLWLLSIGGYVYYHWIVGWSLTETSRFMFDHLFFNDPVWMTLHNTLHSPVVLLTGLALVWQRRRNIGSASRWWFWFFLACLFHSAVDILTHHSDGPLVFFPLNWSDRFYSPVSYWNIAHYAREFAIFEGSLDLICCVYLLRAPLIRYLQHSQLVRTRTF